MNYIRNDKKTQWFFDSLNNFLNLNMAIKQVISLTTIPCNLFKINKNVI